MCKKYASWSFSQPHNNAITKHLFSGIRLIVDKKKKGKMFLFAKKKSENAFFNALNKRLSGGEIPFGKCKIDMCG
jgi:hypothetical protein